MNFMKRKQILPILLLIFNVSNAIGQSSINIYVQANSSTLYHDQPLLLTVILVNSQVQYAIRWNIAVENELVDIDTLLNQKKITQEEYDNERKTIEQQKKKAITVTLGTPTSSWTSSIKWNFSLNGKEVQVPLK